MLFLQTIHVCSTNYTCQFYKYDLHWNKEYYEQVEFEDRYIPLLENRNVKYQMSILKKLNCYKAVIEFIIIKLTIEKIRK